VSSGPSSQAVVSTEPTIISAHASAPTRHSGAAATVVATQIDRRGWSMSSVGLATRRLYAPNPAVSPPAGPVGFARELRIAGRCGRWALQR
jgi:hypothetical protein